MTIKFVWTLNAPESRWVVDGFGNVTIYIEAPGNPQWAYAQQLRWLLVFLICWWSNMPEVRAERLTKHIMDTVDLFTGRDVLPTTQTVQNVNSSEAHNNEK